MAEHQTHDPNHSRITSIRRSGPSTPSTVRNHRRGSPKYTEIEPGVPAEEVLAEMEEIQCAMARTTGHGRNEEEELS